MINVTKTYLPNKEKLISCIDKIYESNWLTNNGPLLQELELRLKEYLGIENILLVSNGTLALQIAYKVLNLKGDILTTPFSFVATTSSQVWEGLNPVFVDIDPNTYTMDYRKIEESITENTSAIVPVHVFGNSCNIEEIQKIADKHNLKVIYDAAHAFAVKYKDKNILNYGDISILSLHSTKLYHTIEGGAMVFKNKEDYERAKLLINFGINGPDSIVDIGINTKMNEFQAAMGLCVLDDVNDLISKREKVYETYMEYIGNNNKIFMQKKNTDSTRNYAYFPVLFPSEKDLLKVRKALNANEIYPRRYFYPSLDSLFYIKGNQHMLISNDISSRILCLPMYDALTREEVYKICSIVNEELGE